jgi:hypothetical protein
MKNLAGNTLRGFIALFWLGMLSACSGGGGDAGDEQPAPQAQQITGVAATDQPMSGSVTAVDANGSVRSASIGSDGVFFLPTDGLAAPLMLHASGPAGDLFSIADDVTGNFNINLLTHLVVELVRLNGGDEPADLFELFLSWNAETDPADLPFVRALLLRVQNVINANLRDLLQNHGLNASTFDFLRTVLPDSQSGFPGVLADIQALSLTDGQIQGLIEGEPWILNPDIDTSGIDVGGSGGEGGSELDLHKLSFTVSLAGGEQELHLIGVELPADQAEFCAAMASRDASISLRRILDDVGDLIIAHCSFDGTTGNVSGWLDISSPLSLPFTAQYRYD